jgi:hypothetical protein
MSDSRMGTTPRIAPDSDFDLATKERATKCFMAASHASTLDALATAAFRKDYSNDDPPPIERLTLIVEEELDALRYCSREALWLWNLVEANETLFLGRLASSIDNCELVDEVKAELRHKLIEKNGFIDWIRRAKETLPALCDDESAHCAAELSKLRHTNRAEGDLSDPAKCALAGVGIGLLIIFAPWTAAVAPALAAIYRCL